MKKQVLSLLFLTMFSDYSTAQWSLYGTDPEDQLKTTHFIDANTGFAAGSSGFIYFTGFVIKTTNGGSSWVKVFEEDEGEIKDLHFTNNNFGAGGGFNSNGDALVITSNNGGNSWSSHIVDDGPTIYGVHFTDENNGYAVGGYAYKGARKTTNGGQTWTLMDMPQEDNDQNFLLGIQFVTPSIGYIHAEKNGFKGGAVYKTIDAGVTWSLVFTRNGQNETLDAMHFYDEMHGVVVGEKISFYTSDGGANWLPCTTPAGSDLDARAVFMISETTGFMIDVRDIYGTTDGGETWQINMNNGFNVLNLDDIHFPNQQTGYAVGSPGVYAKTINSGGILTNAKEQVYYGNVDVYPTPFSHMATIELKGLELKGEKTFLLFNSTGQLMQEFIFENNRLEINGEELNSGIYYFKINNREGVLTTGKVVVME
ncbi:MAG: T9SS type A sorting domain-containing protein [Saprospiraceae bacterium]